MTDDTVLPRPKRRGGFAGMTPERRREIAAKGGRSVPDHMRTFSRDRDLAASAGAKGGRAGRLTPEEGGDSGV